MVRKQGTGTNRSAEMVAAYRRSGRPRKAFCAEMGIPVTTLDYHLRRMNAAKRAAVGLVAVEVKPELAASREPLAFMLRGGLRLEIGARFDEATLRRIVEALA